MTDSPFTIIGDEPVEARIVAWVLGEASGFEAGELERLCEERPELLVFRRRMRALHGLLTDAEAAQPDEGWKLAPEKRRLLDEVLGGPEPVSPEPVVEKRVRHAARRVLLSIAACVLLTFAVLFFIPSDYESEAVIEVKPRPEGDSMFGVQNDAMASAKPMTPQFFATEVETIKSRRNLEQVAGNLDLEKRWNVDRETAIAKLKESIRTENIQGTDLISIRARADNPDDAKQIAREVTKSYQAYRNQIETKEEESALAELNKAVRDQEDKVEERRKLLATIVNTKGIIYKGQDSFYNQGGIDEDQGARTALQEHDKLEGEKRQLKTQLESLLKYDSDQLATYASGLDLPDNAVRSALPKYKEEQRKIESLKTQGLAENHPAVQDAEKKLAETKSQLEEGVTNLRETLTAKMELADARLKEVEKRKDQTREEAIKRGLDAQDYVDARRDFEADQEILQQLKLKKISKDIASRIPSQSVELHDDPIQVEPARKSLASNLLGKVSSLGSVLGGKGQADASKEAPAVASYSATSESKFDVAALRAKNLPASRGMIVERNESEKQVANDEGRITRNAPATPARPPTVSLNTALPAELIEGTPKPINVPNLEIPQNGPAGMSSLAANEKAKDATLSLHRDVATDAKMAAADAPADALVAKEAQSSPRKPAAPASSMARGVAPTPGLPVPDVAGAPPSTALGDGNGFGAGWGGAADSRDRRRDDVAEVDLKNHFTGYTGSTKAGAGTLELSLRAGAERKPSDLSSDYYVADESTKAGVREDVSKVDGRVPTLDEIPALGALFSGKKGNAAPVSGQPSGDGQVAEGGFDGFVNYGTPIAGGGRLAEREVTAGNRSGDVVAGTRNNIDAILNNPGRVAGLDEAQKLRKVGKDKEARQILEKSLAANPGDDAVEEEIKRLEDPIRTNPALTHEQTGKVDEVRRNLYMAEGNMNLGKYDAAKKGYEDTLRIDPYNAAARKGMEQLAAAKSQYYRAAYDHTRAELLMEVDKVWESAAPADGKDGKADDRQDGDKWDLHVGNKNEYLFRGTDLKPDKTTAAVPKPEAVAPVKPDLTKLMEEISAAEDPYSTFSLNINDASFKVAQAALAKGGRPDPAGVKVEQFYNAVDYGDPAPSGSDPVALASEQCAHPVIPGRDLVRVSVKTAAAGRSASQPLRLTLLVDQSGSMVRADRRVAMEKALTSLAGLLTANDRVTLIGFSRTPHLLADGLSGDQAGKLPGMVHQESAEGGTNLEEAIKLAAQLAARHKQAGAQNRIVLFTDGAANLGDADPARLAERVKALRQGGFAFDIAGIAADDLNDELLGDLARNGNGRYYVVGKGDDGEFASRLAGAFRPAAENVKVQVRFNPERVARYKLIGFEKDRLKTEDFRNDAVDAAELAAEEAGVAVYQVETLPGGSGELGEVSVRFRDASTGAMVERSMALPHSGSTPAIDKASPSMQLAVLSMLAAEKLRGGPLGEAIDFSRLSGPCGNVRGFFGSGGRAAEMLQLIEAIK